MMPATTPHKTNGHSKTKKGLDDLLTKEQITKLGLKDNGVYAGFKRFENKDEIYLMRQLHRPGYGEVYEIVLKESKNGKYGIGTYK